MAQRYDHEGRRIVLLNSKNEEVDGSSKSTGCILHPEDRPVHAGRKTNGTGENHDE